MRTKTWKDQFIQSIKKWVNLKNEIKDAGEESDYIGPIILDDYLVLEHSEDEEELLVPGLRAILHHKIRDIAYDLEDAINLSQSPIEKALFLAFIIVGREIFTTVTYVRNGVKSGDNDLRGMDILYIEPQAQLGEYRVDFLLTVKETVPDHDNYRTLLDGSEIPGNKELIRKIIVECDGHDYHERTKDQAKKDKSRDRMLQKIGYRVFRYTGSEIWGDVFKCAQEVIEVLEERESADLRKDI